MGALFKLVAGSPNDLPSVVREFSLPGFAPGPGLILRLAVSIELVLVITGLLRPRQAWPWLGLQYAIFMLVLLSTAFEAKRSAVEPIGLLAALFDPEASCGCFGSKVKIPPGYMLIVDGTLLALLLASRPWRKRLGQWGPDWLPTGLLCLAVVLPWVFQPTSGRTQRPQERRDLPPVGMPAPDGSSPSALPAGAEWWEGLALDRLNYVEIPVKHWEGSLVYDLQFRPFPEDPDGLEAPFWAFLGLEEEVAMLPLDATFVLYRDSCDHCAAHVRELASTDQGERALVFVRIPEPGDPQDLVRLEEVYPEGTPHVSRLDLPPGPPYVFTTPGDFQVDEGVVSAPREGIGR